MVSSYSKAVIFIPICSRPPNGMMRTFGLELVSASTFFALETLAGFSLFTGRSALAGFSVLAARSGFAGFSAFSPRAARSPLAGLSAFSILAAALRLALVVLGFLSSCVFSFSEGSASSSRFGAVFLGLLGPLLRVFLTGRSFFSSCVSSEAALPPSSAALAVFCAFSTFCFASAGTFTLCAASFLRETNSASSASTDFASC